MFVKVGEFRRAVGVVKFKYLAVGRGGREGRCIGLGVGFLELFCFRVFL